MELLYLWIDQFNNIKNQSFVFTSEYNIEYEHALPKLTINKNESSGQYLFDESFLNVTALIGKNGSGKSSLITFLKYIFSKDSPDLRRYLLIIKDNDTFLIVNKTRHQDVALQNQIQTLNNSTFVDASYIHENIELVSVDNSFSIYDNPFKKPSYKDFSLSHLIDDAVKTNLQALTNEIINIENRFNKQPYNLESYERQKLSAINKYNPLSKLYHYEVSNIIDFIAEFHDKKWSFIPKSVFIDFNYDFYQGPRDYFSGHSGMPNLIYIESILNKTPANQSDKEEIIRVFKDKLKLHLFLFFSITAEAYKPLFKAIDDIWHKIYKAKSEQDTLKIIDTFFETKCEQAKWEPIKNICEFFHNLDNEFGSYKSLYSLNFSDRFELNQEVLSSLIKLSKLWEYGEYLFHFSWHGISAGESALLSLLSRLVPSSRYSFVLKDNLWIVFDEPDLYLHPEWQREFFNDLHNYLPKLFPDKKIQLFLTSHSPFLISDLPKENIILLDKDEETGLSKIVTETKLDKTFGTNIHTLLADAFFMNKGLIGEFAKVKIFELMDEIKQLNNPQQSTVENYKKRIDIIGEPMIRQKLYELLLSKVAVDDNAKKREFLQSELDRLNHQNSEE